MFVNTLYNSHVCAVLVSEENDEPIIVDPAMAGMTIFSNISFVTCFHVIFNLSLDIFS